MTKGIPWMRVLVVGLFLFVARRAIATDWPCFGGDAARSGATEEKVGEALGYAWSYMPSQPPRPAWPEPGKEQHRLDFDYAFEPVVAGGLVFFGSSADDTVRALDLRTGKLLWRFPTGGPIRLAPAAAGDRLYIGSDDGFVYCLKAKNGEVVWSFRGGPSDRKMLGNGRMISRWPIRSGVLVADGVLWCAAGMWPTEGVYIYALDAATGRVLWRNDTSASYYISQPHGGASAFTGVCPQGYLLASGDLLLVASGRTTPAALDRKTGKLLYYQPYLKADSAEMWGNRGNGGWRAMIAGDIWLSPLHITGAPDIPVVFGEAGPRPGDGLVAYSLKTGLRERNLAGKHRAAVAGGILYAAGSEEVWAIDLAEWRKSDPMTNQPPREAIRWRAPCTMPYSMVVAGNTLLVGGPASVVAFSTTDGRALGSYTVDGQARAIAVADGRMLVSTDRGRLFCFAPGAHSFSAEVKESRSRLRSKVQDRARAVVARSGVREGYALVAGEPGWELPVDAFEHR
ncbi:MAG: PQQ-binding-like beta-propeller repeat protein, partial [Acidobacteriota bacterium]